MTILDKINSFFLIEFLGNEIYIIFLAVILFFVMYFWLKLIVQKTKKLIKKYTKNKKGENFLIILLNTIEKLPRWFFLIIEIYVPLRVLNLPENIDFAINVIFLFVVILQIIKIISKVLIFSLSNVFKSKNDKKDKTAQKTIEMIVNIVVWVIGILMFLTNIGINLTPIIASLWVASIAVAFALQNILRDLFSSFSIIISKPFDVWDFIVVGEWSKDRMWTVKDITLKSTYLLSIWGHEIIIPNSRILDTEVINYGKMKHRRKRFTIWVTYETAIKKLEKIPKIVENAINQVENVQYERCYLNELSAYSIDFFISYDILPPDYLTSLVVKEKIVLNILKWFEKEWIGIAYPTQTVHGFVNK